MNTAVNNPGQEVNGDYLIRPMTAPDLPSVITIEREAYQYPWTEGVFRDCMRVNYYCCVAEHRGDITGYAVMSLGAGESHVLNLCVSPALRRQGLGGDLLARLIDHARESAVEMMLLEVRVTNHAAIELYKQYGFNEIGMRKAYYPATNGREDALLFARAL